MEAGSSGRIGIAATWAIALAGAVVVLVLGAMRAPVVGGEDGLHLSAALGIVLTTSVFAALLIQLASRRPEGFVVRASASVGGAVVVLALAALVAIPLQLTA